jgi:hypothetical protein
MVFIAKEMLLIGLSQCAILCFEGLLPSPHNEIVIELLFVLAT